jgi:hypothetical protein
MKDEREFIAMETIATIRSSSWRTQKMKNRERGKKKEAQLKPLPIPSHLSSPHSPSSPLLLSLILLTL